MSLIECCVRGDLAGYAEASEGLQGRYQPKNLPQLEHPMRSGSGIAVLRFREKPKLVTASFRRGPRRLTSGTAVLRKPIMKHAR